MYKITAIVLRAFAFSDSKLMVDVLSREEGRASCVVLVGSSKKGKSLAQGNSWCHSLSWEQWRRSGLGGRIESYCRCKYHDRV